MSPRDSKVAGIAYVTSAVSAGLALGTSSMFPLYMGGALLLGVFIIEIITRPEPPSSRGESR